MPPTASSAVRPAASPTAGTAVGDLVLLQVDAAVDNLIAEALADEIDLRRLADAEQLYTALEQGRPSPCAMVIGAGIAQPVRVVQHARSLGADMPVLILTDGARREQLEQTLRFAPFIGSDVKPWSIDDLAELPAAVNRAVERSSKRHQFRGSVAEAQRRIGRLPANPPQVTHFVERLLDRAPIGVLNVDVRCMILSVNRYACQVLGVSERGALGTPFTRFLPPAAHARLRNLIGRCVAPLRKQTPEVVEINADDGRLRHVEVIASSLVDRTGQLGSTLILQDVTDRVLAEHKRLTAEAALRDGERRYRELVQTMNEGLAMTDAQYRITFVNQAFCDMFGFDSEALVGRPLNELVHPDHASLLREHMAIRGTCGSRRFETAWIAGDGQLLHTLTSPRHFFDESGDFTGCLGVFTDISESKRVERRERQQLLELAHVSRVTTIGQMSSQIAHELSQPLTAINALSRALVKLFEADAASIDETRDTLREISGQAQRARDIVIRLRDFVRKSELQFTAVDLNDTIRTVLRLANAEPRHRGMTVELDLAAGLPEVSADRVLIEQVLLNLVRNALDAMESVPPEQRRLHLSSALLTDHAIRVTVADSGPGVADDCLRDLFEPFFTTKNDGMGMGLAITRSVIQAHGGTIEVVANPGGGALFRFILPTTRCAEPV